MSDVRVTIIDVDIGDISKIITDDLSEITDKNRQNIDSAIEASKQLENLRNRKSKEDDEREAAMDALFAELSTCSSNNQSMSSKRIIELGSATGMTNMISFVGRMRNWLKVKGHQFKLVSTRSGKETGYRLEASTADGATPPSSSTS